MHSTQNIYDKSAAIIRAADKQEALKALPTSIIVLIAHGVSFQIFPSDDEKTIIERIKVEQTREINLLARSSSLKGIEGAAACKKLPDSQEVSILIKKMNLLIKPIRKWLIKFPELQKIKMGYI
jgi:hypothetical protein